MKKTLWFMLGVIVAVMALGVAADETTYWPRWSRIKIGQPLPDTNNVYIYFEDNKMYFMDYAGANRKRLRIGDLDYRISYADSLARAPYVQAGTAFGAPDYPLRVNGTSLFYGDVYLKDGQSILDYSGNGARIKLINATGVQIMNNSGIAVQVAANAAASSIMVDSVITRIPGPIQHSLHAIVKGDSVFGNTFIRNTDSCVVTWNGSAWIIIKDLTP